MQDMGADPATKQTIPFDAGDKKYMDTLFADVFAPLEKNGVDFWWLDWQQYPYTRSVPDLTNLFWLNTLLVSTHRAERAARLVVLALGGVGRSSAPDPLLRRCQHRFPDAGL